MTTDIDIFTVTDVTRHVKALLEEAFPAVRVTGEVSDFKHPSSGHMYFSLKDDRSVLQCAMFRRQNQALSFMPANGMQVIAQGDLTVYEARGQYQLIAHYLQPAGEGALQAAFEQLKARLAAEGLFDEDRKQPLPEFPERVGVITSETGAAIRDIIRVLHRRSPWVDIILNPVRVQGEGAATEIAAAIHEMNAYGQVDVIIVGRGGGSMEDLWAFNEEPVVRAIAASEIPIVSAVGHEVDYTLADFAADVRAPTPSGAAEQVVRDHVELRDRLASMVNRLYGGMKMRMTDYRQHLHALVSSYGFRRPIDRIVQQSQRVDDLSRRLLDQCARRMEHRRHAAQNVIGRLNAMNPLAVLERGYAVCRAEPDGSVLRDTAALTVGDYMNVTFFRGQATCRVEQIDGADTAPASGKQKKKQSAESREDIRLNLFD